MSQPQREETLRQIAHAAVLINCGVDPLEAIHIAASVEGPTEIPPRPFLTPAPRQPWWRRLFSRAQP